MPKIRVLLDACVLVPYELADFLLRLADADLYEPLWSEEILTEVDRNLVQKFGVTKEKAAQRAHHWLYGVPAEAAAARSPERIAPSTQPHMTAELSVPAQWMRPQGSRRV
nr:PIN domain-containing protein [Mycobacterium malmoense]